MDYEAFLEALEISIGVVLELNNLTEKEKFYLLLEIMREI